LARSREMVAFVKLMKLVFPPGNTTVPAVLDLVYSLGYVCVHLAV